MSWKSVLFGVVVAVALVASFMAGRMFPSDPVEPVEKVDTLWAYDTIKVVEPKYITKRVVDSVLVPVKVTDTLMMKDTIFVSLEREQVRWEDTLSVVYASGVLPKVDSVIHHVTEKTIIKKIPVKVRSRWGVGVQVGAGVAKSGISPYVGVGVSYNIIIW